MSPPWTTREARIVRRMYPTHSFDEISATLFKRSPHSIRDMAFRLGLRRGGRPRRAADQLRRVLTAQSYFIDREIRGVLAAQDRFTSSRGGAMPVR